MTPSSPTLTAYQIEPAQYCDLWALQPASQKRPWMDTNQGHAYRCLPLVVANHMGWIIEFPVTVHATWNGEIGNSYEVVKEAITFDFDCPPKFADYFGRHIVSDFGNGIMSIALPWLFRTTEPDGLVVRGAPNYWVEGATPLDGFVETNWLPFTFTMNWKLHTPHKTVTFEKGTPLTFVYPYNIQTLKNYSTDVKTLADNPELEEAYKKWYFMRQVTRTSDISDTLPSLSNRYTRGKDYDGNRPDEHDRALRLPPFSPQSE